jgi:hypothetical protein
VEARKKPKMRGARKRRMRMKRRNPYVKVSMHGSEKVQSATAVKVS